MVRWIRTFPFGFITDREYVIARALFAVTPDGAVHRGLPPPARLMGHPSGPSASLSALQVGARLGGVPDVPSQHQGPWSRPPGPRLFGARL